jgi:glutamate carboxypeptidase
MEKRYTAAARLGAVTSAIKTRQGWMLERLRKLVEVESPSNDKAAVDRAATLVAEWCTELGGRVKRHRQREYGDLLEVRFGPVRTKQLEHAKQKPVMLLGHLDTVWPLGTLQTMPWREDKKKIYGPGVYDMKAGVLMALTAIAALQDCAALTTPVVMMLASEEEIGSPVSRAVTERLARGCSAAFVLEPAQGAHGAYKTARKGVGDYLLRVRGVAAHSGVDFEKGHSAVLELMRLLAKVETFTDLKRGLTVNPGVIGGGTRSNVIAAEAWAEVDVRIVRAGDAARVEKMFRGLRCADKHCTLEVSGGMNRPPMERTAAIAKLFKRARKIAAEMGVTLEEAATGGGSDGNFTAAVGTPTLDGMGPVGEGAHAAHESLWKSSLVERTVLLAGMLLAGGA